MICYYYNLVCVFHGGGIYTDYCVCTCVTTQHLYGTREIVCIGALSSTVLSFKVFGFFAD